MKSSDLMQSQELMQVMVNDLINEPMKNWSLINKYLSVIKDIDSKRRELWNKEKFGAYDDMADECLSILRPDFTADDIPF